MRMLDGKLYINFEAQSFTDLYKKMGKTNCLEVPLCLKGKERNIILEFLKINKLFAMSLYIMQDLLCLAEIVLRYVRKK